MSAAAHRLRDRRSELADSDEAERRSGLIAECERLIGEVPSGDREAFARALASRFPLLEDAAPECTAGEGDTSAAPPGAQAVTAAVAQAAADPLELVRRLAELTPALSPDARMIVMEYLAEAGLVAPGPAEAGAPPAAAAPPAGAASPAHTARLATLLQLDPGDALDAARVAAAAAMLADVVLSLDQVVWNTWKAVSPQSALKRPQPLKSTLSRYAGSHPDADEAQLKADLERLRQLTASMLASVSQAGRQFAQRHVERFAPGEIEAMAKLAGGGLLVGHEVKCWRKYVELAGPLDAAGIERELLGAMAGYAESLMRGLSR